MNDGAVLARVHVLPTEARLCLLGSFRLEVNGTAVVLPTPCQRMLALVCLRDRLSRRQLSGRLWPETASGQALTNLRQTLFRLQKAARCVELVVDTGAALELGPTVTSDVGWLRSALGEQPERSSLDPDRALRELAYAEDLLDDWDEDWLADDRERIRQLRLHVLEQWAVGLAEAGQHGYAVEAALAALRSDPLRESAHRTLIRVHLAEGNTAEALRAYRRCRQVLMEEVGEEPLPETTALLVRVADRA